MDVTVNTKMSPQELTLIVEALRFKVRELTADIDAGNFEPQWRRDARAEIVRINELLEKLA